MLVYIYVQLSEPDREGVYRSTSRSEWELVSPEDRRNLHLIHGSQEFRRATKQITEDKGFVSYEVCKA